MQKKYKILISAYACSPYHGSEPGMGWNFVFGLAKFHELHVIVEKQKWQKEIEKYLSLHPVLKSNLKFYFIEKKRNKFLRKIWPPSYYWYYKEWQKNAFKLSLELEKTEKFNLIHQLNMVGYREPGFLWRIKKPFVWGPVGGLENSPWSFLPSLGFSGLIFYASRNILNSIQRNFLKRPKLAMLRENNFIISATIGNQKVIKKLWDIDSDVICEVGQEKNHNLIQPSKRITLNEPLKLIWSGQHTRGKNLSLLLNALSSTSIRFELHILGCGAIKKQSQNLAKKLNIENKCKWYGWLKREDAINVMQRGHLFCITSIKDLTSSVLLEAISYGLPVITLDHCGFSFIIDDTCGIKIPLSTPAAAQSDFLNAIEKLYFDETLRQKLSIGAINRAKEFDWDSKIEKLNTIYNKLIL